MFVLFFTFCNGTFSPIIQSRPVRIITIANRNCCRKHYSLQRKTIFSREGHGTERKLYAQGYISDESGWRTLDRCLFSCVPLLFTQHTTEVRLWFQSSYSEPSTSPPFCLSGDRGERTRSFKLTQVMHFLFSVWTMNVWADAVPDISRGVCMSERLTLFLSLFFLFVLSVFLSLSVCLWLRIKG